MTTTKTIFRKDYTPPTYTIEAIDLQITLSETGAEVHSKLQIVRLPETSAETPLILHGRELSLIDLQLNQKPHVYEIKDEQLILHEVPSEFTLEIKTQINPQLNTSLEGLYKVKNLFCTQCEPQGFRKITYYLDRPDVMATFTTKIIADKARYPILLSNGNLIEKGDLPNNQHFVKWHDPFKKPCYLFALVAGDLACTEDRYITQSGRYITLKLYVDHGDEDKADFAMQSIKRAMAWDEKTYGREYDLDIFMVVSTHDFNMGAMENKGLNIFNSKYILAKPSTATDEDFVAIERVIGHEYFHNWTGNRITCRDWFELSLKEGLTVFRDAQFSADMTSPAVVRIGDVNRLRSIQFPQDAGPMAHPVRPNAYMEINNFYTVTIYEKGAEVIRMLKTLLGEEGYYRGMDLYFKRHDGQAVTLEDFVQAHADANHRDLSHFMRWYDQAGTPELTVDTEWDATKKSYRLSVKQFSPPTPDQLDKEALLLPLTIGLLNTAGKEIMHKTVELTQTEQTFCFENIDERPLLSLLRDFSAPVKIHYSYTPEECAFLLQHDKDPVARWDAGQQLAVRIIRAYLDQTETYQPLVSLLIKAWQNILEETDLDPAFAALLLTLPTESYLIELFAPLELDPLFEGRRWLRQQLAEQLQETWSTVYHRLEAATKQYQYDARHIGQRALKNCCLNYLGLIDTPDHQALILAQLNTATNMTDEIAALACLSHSNTPIRETALNQFYDKWKKETLVIDKWLSLQARSTLPDTLSRVKILMQHPAFEMKNPNKVRALVSAFCQNLPQFHAIDGRGYRFLTEQIIRLNEINPMVGARLTEPFTHWKKYDESRQALIKQQLEEIAKIPDLAIDIYEVVTKSLQ